MNDRYRDFIEMTNLTYEKAKRDLAVLSVIVIIMIFSVVAMVCYCMANDIKLVNATCINVTSTSSEGYASITKTHNSSRKRITYYGTMSFVDNGSSTKGTITTSQKTVEGKKYLSFYLPDRQEFIRPDLHFVFLGIFAFIVFLCATIFEFMCFLRLRENTAA